MNCPEIQKWTVLKFKSARSQRSKVSRNEYSRDTNKSEKTFLCPDQCDPEWENCSGDGMQFRCLDNDEDEADPSTTLAPSPSPEPASECRENHLYDQDFVLFDKDSEQTTYKEGTTVDISCAKYTYPTLNRVSFRYHSYKTNTIAYKI